MTELIERDILNLPHDKDWNFLQWEGTPQAVDFTHVKPISTPPSGNVQGPATYVSKTGEIDYRPHTADGKLLTKKQIRMRAKRRMARAKAGRLPGGKLLTEEEFNAIFKPIEEWDLEELAHGRPRNKAGDFRGPKPKWINREIHEKSVELFTTAVKTQLGAKGIAALEAISDILSSTDTDRHGKPIVPASTKLDASKFLIEHIVGKPKQHIETDISVRLQAILGAVMVNPTDALSSSPGNPVGPYSMDHYPGVTVPIGSRDPDIVDGEVVDDEDLDDYIEDDLR